jgi:hypothetical protein
VSQNSSATFSRDRLTTSTYGIRRVCYVPPWRLEVRHRSSTLDGCRSRRTVVVTGVPQQSATLAGGDPRLLLRPASTGRRRGRAGTVVPFLHLDRVGGHDAFVVVGEPVGQVTVEVDPFDAELPPLHAVTTYTVAIPRLQGSLAAGLQRASTRWPRPPIRLGHREATSEDPCPQVCRRSRTYENIHCEDRLDIVDTIAVYCLLFPTTTSNTPPGEPCGAGLGKELR